MQSDERGGRRCEFRGLHRIIRPTRAFVLLAAAATERAFGYTRACSRSPIPPSPRIAIGAHGPPARIEKPNASLIASVTPSREDANNFEPAAGESSKFVDLVPAGLATAKAAERPGGAP